MEVGPLLNPYLALYCNNDYSIIYLKLVIKKSIYYKYIHVYRQVLINRILLDLISRALFYIFVIY